jgi:chemotaxis protein MotA
MFILIGYALAFINLLIVIAMTADSFKIYLDLHAFICVFGGTVISIFIAFKPSGIKRVWHLYSFATKRKEDDIVFLISEIVRVAKETRGEINQNYLSGFRSNNYFLKDGLQLISDGFSRTQIEVILSERLSAVEERYKDDERFIKSISKVPPSFGLVGTTVGLIALFAQVGAADAMKKIGPAMAVAMTATLYGLFLSFVVFNPMADRISEINLNNLRIRQLVLSGILYLKDKASPLFIEEVLKGYLAFGAQNKIRVGK